MNEKDFKRFVKDNRYDNYFEKFIKLLTTDQKRRLLKKYKEDLRALT